MMPSPISINRAFETVAFLPNRVPNSSDDDKKDAFAELSKYRDGAIYIAHYAGNSEWEKHPQGDEMVQIIEGSTTLILLIDGTEQRNQLSAGELLVVPQGIWHRFESPLGVKALTITPQPTEHSQAFPL